jgi:hypothetical protein
VRRAALIAATTYAVHPALSVNFGKLSRSVMHGLAQLQVPSRFAHLPDARKSGDGETFAGGLPPGRMPVATAGGEIQSITMGAIAVARTPRMRTRRVLS